MTTTFYIPTGNEMTDVTPEELHGRAIALPVGISTTIGSPSFAATIFTGPPAPDNSLIPLTDYLPRAVAAAPPAGTVVSVPDTYANDHRYRVIRPCVVVRPSIADITPGSKVAWAVLVERV